MFASAYPCFGVRNDEIRKEPRWSNLSTEALVILFRFLPNSNCRASHVYFTVALTNFLPAGFWHLKVIKYETLPLCSVCNPRAEIVDSQ